MGVSLPWLRSGLRTLVLGTLLAAGWIIFGAASAHAFEPLPPVTDAVHKITGNETASGSIAEAPVITEEEPRRAEAPVAALLEPAIVGAEPLIPAARQIVDPVLAPVEAAVAPVAAPVTSVVGQVTEVAGPMTGLATDVFTPVTSTVADLTAPVTGTLAHMVAPVTASVASTISPVAVVVGEDPTAAAVSPSAASEAINGSSNDAPGGDAASGAPDLSGGPSVRFDAGNVPPLRQDQSAFPVSTAGGETSEIQTQNPGPDLPNRPGPGSPATAPTGSGSTFRSASEAGSAFADGLAVFQLSLTRTLLTDVFRRSDELPGSISLEHGFSPD
ncbi:hypothetical protein ACIQCM_07485 [Pseudarthrobacter sp. NPDC092439]|uniref:hypothetical protein n=1 Tax=unclassified Pseudarthrobacter TaxID=2647000 RepID=UPI0038023DDA